MDASANRHQEKGCWLPRFHHPCPQDKKVFWFFFSKKNFLLFKDKQKQEVAFL
jgi:hypothetical protein